MINRIKEIFQGGRVILKFMGGSVTEGFPYDERVKTPYPNLVCDGFQKMFPQKEILGENLGICGEQSSHAMMVCEEKLKKTEKQIIFLEYALTDDMTQTSIKVFESLLRKLIRFKGHPAVIPIILPGKKNERIAAYMAKICEHYHIPYCGFDVFLKSKLETGAVKWEEYSFDDTHPHQKGHQMIADFVVEQVKECLEAANPTISYKLPKNRFYLSPYEHMKITHISKEFSFPLTFEVECKTFWISYIQHNENFMGNLQVFVDEKLLYNLHGKSFYCWYYPVQQKLFEYEQKGKHTITMLMAPGDEKKTFMLEYVGIC